MTVELKDWLRSNSWLVSFGYAEGLVAAAEGFVHRLDIPDLQWLQAATIALSFGAFTDRKPDEIQVFVALPTQLFQQMFGATYLELKRPLHLRDTWNPGQFQRHYFTEKELETLFGLVVDGDRSLRLSLMDWDHYTRTEAESSVVLSQPDMIPRIEEPPPEPEPAPLASGQARSHIEANLYRAMMGRNARLQALVDSNETVAQALFKLALGIDNFARQHRLRPRDMRLRWVKMSRAGEIVLKIDRLR